MKPQVIAVDVDGTLCEGAAWTPEDCLKALPKQEIIDWVNEQYKTNFIVIHTARRHGLYEATVKWLNRNSVGYHAIHMEKMGSDIYLDDKSITPQSLTQTHKNVI